MQYRLATTACIVYIAHRWSHLSFINAGDLLELENSLSSDISSGYSTTSNDNLPSPALYLPPPSGEGVYSELEQREGGVSGWDHWRITESEVSLGTVITSTERETVYRQVL